MISRKLETKNGITYWNIASDDADDIVNGSTRDGAFFRDSITGGGGNDTLNGGSGSDTLDGGDGNDKVTGGSGNNVVNGGNGNDRLGGLGGDDTIDGGSGNDALAGGDDNDLLVQLDFRGADTLDGGRGTDTADYSGAPRDGDSGIDNGSVHVSLASGTVGKYLDGVLSATDTIRNVDRFIVTDLNDTLEGNSGDNVLEGLLGNDVLNGGDGDDTLAGDFSAKDQDPPNAGGDDTLNGGKGSDSLYGGVGNDRFVQDNVYGSDKIDGGADTDTVDYSGVTTAAIVANLVTGKVDKFSFGYHRGIDTLRNIETLIATDLNDTLTGGGHDNLLAGGAGNDQFAMLVAAGNDTLDGGSGADKLDYSGDPAAFLNAGTWIRPAGGNAAGLAGAFPFIPNDLSLKFDLQAGTVAKFQHEGLIGTVSFTNIESFVGSGSADTLIGSDGDDLFDGNTGNDIMNGGAGNDLLMGGDGNDFITQTDLLGSDTFAGGAGNDTLDYSELELGGGKLVVDFFEGAVSKTDAAGSTTNDFFSGIEHVIGSTGDDFIGGSNAFAETLEGGAGNDWLASGFGDGDSVLGGDGDDRIVQDSPASSGNGLTFNVVGTKGDTIDGGSGFDTVDYSGFKSGPGTAHVEVDLYAGTVTKFYNGAKSTAIDILKSIEAVIGTENGDFMAGSVRADDLRGGGGNDTMSGSAGNDKLSGGDGDDLLFQQELFGNDTFDGGEGSDTLDYSHIPGSNGFVSIDWANGRVFKFSATEQALGMDVFSNIEHILVNDGTGFDALVMQPIVHAIELIGTSTVPSVIA